jgi:hypothetical protein
LRAVVIKRGVGDGMITSWRGNSSTRRLIASPERRLCFVFVSAFDFDCVDGNFSDGSVLLLMLFLKVSFYGVLFLLCHWRSVVVLQPSWSCFVGTFDV